MQTVLVEQRSPTKKESEKRMLPSLKETRQVAPTQKIRRRRAEVLVQEGPRHREVVSPIDVPTRPLPTTKVVLSATMVDLAIPPGNPRCPVRITPLDRQETSRTLRLRAVIGKNMGTVIGGKTMVCFEYHHSISSLRM